MRKGEAAVHLVEEEIEQKPLLVLRNTKLARLLQRPAKLKTLRKLMRKKIKLLVKKHMMILDLEKMTIKIKVMRLNRMEIVELQGEAQRKTTCAKTFWIKQRSFALNMQASIRTLRVYMRRSLCVSNNGSFSMTVMSHWHAKQLRH